MTGPQINGIAHRSRMRRLPALLVGLFWSVASAGMAVELLADPLGVPRAGQTWANGFSPFLLWAVVLGEGSAAVLLWTGKVRAGAMLGLGLLCIYSLALTLWPVDRRLPCGCLPFQLGDTLTFVHPVARNFALATVHVFTIALTYVNGSRQPIDAKATTHATAIEPNGIDIHN